MKFQLWVLRVLALLCVYASDFTLSRAEATPLRYSITTVATNVVFGTAIPNCATNTCSVTLSGGGDSNNATAFPLMCVGGGTSCVFKSFGASGFWNRSLTSVTVTVYDPVSGITYGPASFPAGYFVSFDNYNGGIGFGADGPAGPAYPASLAFGGDFYAYGYTTLSSTYNLETPILVGGQLDPCPAGGTCASNPPPSIPVTLADGTTVPFYFQSGVSQKAQFSVREAPVASSWVPAAPMSQPRANMTATTLLDGRVLVVGGSGGLTSAATAEIYSPTQNSWAPAAAPTCQRSGHSATLLADGRVLVIGGTICPQTAEIYNPASDAWSAATAPSLARPAPAAIRLPDGRVLVTEDTLAETYSPTTNAWSATTGFAPVVASTSAILPSGLVVSFGSQSPTGTASIGSIEVFDPSTNAWSARAALGLSLSTSGYTVNPLPDGTVLVTGNAGTNNYDLGVWWSLYDPVADAWNLPTVNNLPSPGVDPEMLPMGGYAGAQTLIDGRVLLSGGYSNFGGAAIGTQPVQMSVLYDPVSQTWFSLGALNDGRYGHALALLADGEVLAVGGESTLAANTYLASVERFIPAPALLAASSVSITTDVNPVATGQPLTLFATVTGPAGTQFPTGVVQFRDGSKSLGAPVALSSGEASFSAVLGLGVTHNLTAVYFGDANNPASVSPVIAEGVQNTEQQFFGFSISGSGHSGSGVLGGVPAGNNGNFFVNFISGTVNSQPVTLLPTSTNYLNPPYALTPPVNFQMFVAGNWEYDDIVYTGAGAVSLGTSLDLGGLGLQTPGNSINILGSLPNAVAAGSVYAYSDDTLYVNGTTTYVPITFTLTPIPASSLQTAPVLLSASIASAQRIRLVWAESPNSTAQPVTGYGIWRSTNGASAVLIASVVGPNTHSYSDVSVVAGNSYAYTIRADNPTGPSEASNPLAVAFSIPSAPTGLSATVGIASVRTDSVTLVWAAATGASFYDVTRASDAAFTTRVSTRSNVRGTSLIETVQKGTSGVTTYYFRVTARNALGVSGPSETVTAVTQ